MSPRISVAMATYNGEKYLQEQLDSLASQTFLPCELVVGDDGSTDSTIAILEAFARCAPFPVRIVRNPVNLGFADNFLETASVCSGDWIAFCDQDDVWLPQKLERCARAIGRNPNLNLVLQNADLCDARLNRRGRLFPNSYRPGVYHAGELYGFWVWHGFLQTVRSTLIRNVPYKDRPVDCSGERPTRTHDQWTCTIANALGAICVLSGSTALYRRHEKTITNNYPGRNLRKQIEDAIRTGFEHYSIQTARAAASALILRRLGQGARTGDWADKFHKSALLFDRVSEVQSNRARLYASKRFVDRLRYLARLWLMGGYVGPSFIAMGWRSALKDAAVTLIGSKGGRAMVEARHG